jgi:hypothetical protein
VVSSLIHADEETDTDMTMVTDTFLDYAKALKPSHENGIWDHTFYKRKEREKEMKYDC